MDGKKSVLVAAGIIAVAAIVVVAVYVLAQATGVLGNADEENVDAGAGTGTSSSAGYANTGKPTPFGNAATAQANDPNPGTLPGSTGSDPFGVSVNANRTFGMVMIGIEIADGTTTVDMSKVSVEAECSGKTYQDLWKLQSTDWTSTDGDTILEPGEVVTIVINNKAKGIPFDQPMTIRLMKDGGELLKITATPT